MATRYKIDRIDVEEMCDLIRDNVSLQKVAEHFGISRGGLVWFLSTRPDVSAKVNAARMESGHSCSDDARIAIESAQTPLEQVRARDLAHHLRWHASKITQQFGDKSTIVHAGAVAHLGADDLSQDERAFIAAQVTKDL